LTAPLGLLACGVRRRGQEAERVLWERSVVEQRYDAVREVLEGQPVTEVAARYGISRQSVYTWVGR
jgi:DNA invertase Pin-like site-specific DNA recombinase